jgi:hypothetical protein
VLILFSSIAARATEAVDYADWPTLYESQLSTDVGSSIAASEGLLLTLSDGVVTVWDSGHGKRHDLVQRGSVSVGDMARFLVERAGEFYLFVEKQAMDDDEQDGFLEWVDVSNPDAPTVEFVRHTGYIHNVMSWGNALIYEIWTTKEHYDWQYDEWTSYIEKSRVIFPFYYPTNGSPQVFPLECDDWAASNSQLWLLRDAELTVHPVGTNLYGSEAHGVTLPARRHLISAIGDRLWLGGPDSFIESYRVDENGEIYFERTYPVVGTPEKVYPWDGGLLLTGSFGVQTLSAQGDHTSIWTVSQAPEKAVVRGDRAWVLSASSGIAEIRLDVPRETPPPYGQVFFPGISPVLSSDGKYLFRSWSPMVDVWDLEGAEGPVLANRTYVGSGTRGLDSNGDLLLIYSPSYAQVFRLDSANALPSFECGFRAENPIDAGVVVEDDVILLSRQYGIEIHSIPEGGALIGRIEAGDMAPWKLLHRDGTIVWCLARESELVGISIEDPSSPQFVAQRDLEFAPSGFNVDHGDIVARTQDGSLRACRYRGRGRISAPKTVLPGEKFSGSCLRDGILYTSRSSGTQIYDWRSGNPKLLGLQEGSLLHRPSTLMVQGGSLAINVRPQGSDSYTKIYPAQRARHFVQAQVEGSFYQEEQNKNETSASAAIGLRILDNPARGSLRVSYSVPRASAVSIGIYDLAGRRIAHVQNGNLSQGSHVLHWDGRDDGGRTVARGTYFLRIENEGHFYTKKFALVR